MVLLRLTVKVLPREPVPAPATSSSGSDSSSDSSSKDDGEKGTPEKITAFLLIVRGPEHVTLGKLSWMITEKWAKLRPDAGPLEIKKLLDDDHADMDLDADLTVSDVFVDSGKALADGLDQRAVVRVVQKPSDCRIRHGSVVQDWNLAASQYASEHASEQSVLHSFSADHDSERMPAVPEVVEPVSDDAMDLDRCSDGHDGDMSPLLPADVEPEQTRVSTSTTTAAAERPRRETRSLLAQAVAASDNAPRTEESAASQQAGRPQRQRPAATASADASRRKTTSLVDRFTSDSNDKDLAPSTSSASSHALKRRWSAFNPTAAGDNDGYDKEPENHIQGEQAGKAGDSGSGRAKRQNTTKKDTKRLRDLESIGADNEVEATTVDEKTSEDTTAEKTTAQSAATHQEFTHLQSNLDIDQIAMDVMTTPTSRDTARRPAESLRQTKAEAAAQREAKQLAPVEQNEEPVTGVLTDNTSAKKATPDLRRGSRQLQFSSPKKTSNSDLYTASQEPPAPNGPDREDKRRTSVNTRRASGSERKSGGRNASTTATSPAAAAKDAPKAVVNGPKSSQKGLDNATTPPSTELKSQDESPQHDTSQRKRKDIASSPTPASLPSSKRRAIAPSPELSGDPDPPSTRPLKDNNTPAAAAAAAKDSHPKDTPNKTEVKTPTTDSGPVDVAAIIASSKSAFPPNVTKEWIAAYQEEQDWEYRIKVAKEQGKSSKEIGLMNSVLAQTKNYGNAKRNEKSYEARRARKRLNQAKRELADFSCGDHGDWKHGDAHKKTKSSPEEKKKPSPEEKKKPSPEEKKKPAPEEKKKPSPEEKKKPSPEEKTKDSEKSSGTQQSRALRQSVLSTVEPTGAKSNDKSATPKSAPHPTVCVPPLERVWSQSELRLGYSTSSSATKTDKNTKAVKQQQDTASSERKSIANRGLVSLTSESESESGSALELNLKLDKVPASSNVAVKKESAAQHQHKKSPQQQPEVGKGNMKKGLLSHQGHADKPESQRVDADRDVVVLTDDQTNTREDASAKTATGKKKYPGLPSLPSHSDYEVNEVPSDSDASVLLSEVRSSGGAARKQSGNSNGRATTTAPPQRSGTRTGAASGPASSPLTGQSKKKEDDPAPRSSWHPSASLNVLGLWSPPPAGMGSRSMNLKRLQENFPGFTRLTRSNERK